MNARQSLERRLGFPSCFKAPLLISGDSYANSSLFDHFLPLDDSRQSWKAVYPLGEIFLIVLSGVMTEADDFVEIGLWTRWCRHELEN